MSLDSDDEEILNQPCGWTKKDVIEMFDDLTTVDSTMLDRLFIVQVAADDGWNMAKEVALYQSGKYANPHYQKAAEKKEKREKEALKIAEASKTIRKPHKAGGYHGQSFGGYNQPMRRAGNHGGYSGPSTGNAVQCYNCQQFGHIARDCRNKPAAAGAPYK